MDEIDKWLEIAKELLKEWEEQMEPDSDKRWDRSWGAFKNLSQFL